MDRFCNNGHMCFVTQMLLYLFRCLKFHLSLIRDDIKVTITLAEKICTSSSFSYFSFHFLLLSIPTVNAMKWGMGYYFSFHSTPAAAAAAKSLQSCPTLCDPMDCSLPCFSVHGILQARTLEWVAISFSILFLAPLK